MRLIDAELMAAEECEAYMRAQLKLDDEPTKAVNHVVHKKIQMLLADAPTVDAVPVVRCKNCVHRHWTQEPEHGKTVHYCDIFEEQIADNFFCGKGERL